MSSSHPLKPIRSPAHLDHPLAASAHAPAHAPAHAAAWDASRRRELRVIARVYAAAQARRLRVEARLRARLREHPSHAPDVSRPDGVDAAEGVPAEGDPAVPRLTAAALVAALRRAGAADGPPHGQRAPWIATAVGESALLGLMRDSYLRCVDDERALRAALVQAAEYHPVWPWASRVPGVSTGLVARLLGRLDLAPALRPSSFARYCGLATESARSSPTGSPPPTGRPRRRAQRRAVRGEPARYDQEAKRLCHFLALRLLRADGPYAALYHGVLARRLAQRPAEPAARHGVAARRAMQQAFLYHLWACWRDAVGLDVPRPYAEARLGLRALPDYRRMTGEAG